MKEQLLLQLRSAIADKEWVIACANMETAHRDQWSCDWHQGIRGAQGEIDRLVRRLMKTIDVENRITTGDAIRLRSELDAVTSASQQDVQADADKCANCGAVLEMFCINCFNSGAKNRTA